MLKIVQMQKGHFKAYRKMLDQIAREGKYLLILQAPSLKTLSQIIAENKKNNGVTTVALVVNKVVGWCNVKPHGRPTTSHIGVLGMGVHADFRGKGIGAQLLQNSLDRAKANGFEIIHLDVLASNRAALKLYKKAGFKIEGKMKNARKYKGKYEDLILMAKSL